MPFPIPAGFEEDVVIVLDRSGYIRFMTSPTTGYPDRRQPDEVVGHHLREFVHPDDVPNFENWLCERGSNGPAVISHVMIRTRSPDGVWRWLQVIHPQLRSHVSDHIFLILRDIEAHELVEHQYRMLEKLTGHGIWNISSDSSHAYLSVGMVRLFGFEPGEPETKRKFWPLAQVDRSDVKEVLRTLRRALESPKNFSFTCTARTKHGSKRIIKTTGYVEPDAAGRDTLFGVSEDITSIHLVETRLRASEQQYRLLTQRASDIIFQLSTDGVIEFISPSVRRLTGRRPGRLAGLNFRTLLPDSEHEKFDSFLLRLSRGDEEASCTVRFMSAGRENGWLEISGRALKDETGRVKGLVCTARDISERKEAELELRKARQQADEANASKSRFLANVSHELRTPLNAILGFSELIRNCRPGAESDQKTAEYAALIHESGNMLTSLINDLLDLEKIGAGKYELKPEQFALKEIIPTAIQQLSTEAVKKNIKIENWIEDRELTVIADKRALTQILINLLSNAVKFSRDGGRIEILAETGDSQVDLKVRDSGIGIRQEDIERITAPFEQAAEGRELASRGTGLGLALVKSLVELHGGKLGIDSNPGDGTTVSVVLPREFRQQAA